MLATRPLHNTTANTWGKQHEVSRPAVKRATSRKSGERLKWIAAILFCTAVLSVIIAQYSAIAKVNIDVERTRMQVEEQAVKNAKLNDRVNELSSPTLVMAKAREMGMESTNPGVVAKIGKE